MMLYPAISELESITKSRYALVIVTAKRARQLLESAEANKVVLEDKPVKLAIEDIASGRVKCKEVNYEGLAEELLEEPVQNSDSETAE